MIFTTHSNDALDPLPPKAIWAAYNGEVLQGKLDIKALRTITGQIDAKLALFVEDAFAEFMVTTALALSRRDRDRRGQDPWHGRRRSGDQGEPAAQCGSDV